MQLSVLVADRAFFYKALAVKFKHNSRIVAFCDINRTGMMEKLEVTNVEDLMKHFAISYRRVVTLIGTRAWFQ